MGGRGQSNREVARLLGVTEGAVRYHRRRPAAEATDGRTGQPARARAYHDAITAWLDGADEATPSNVAALHAWLVAEHDYPGTLRSARRYSSSSYHPSRTRCASQAG